MLAVPARGAYPAVPVPNAKRARSVAQRRRPAPRRRHTRKRSGRSTGSCCNSRSAAVPQRLRGVGCHSCCFCVCGTEFLSRKNCCAGHRTHQYERQRLARTPQRGLLRFPGARQEGIARSLSMHRHPQGYALCRLAHFCAAPRKVCSASPAYVRTTGRIAYFAHHPQKSMQRLTGLCSHYGPYCILCILFGHFAKLFFYGELFPLISRVRGACVCLSSSSSLYF